MLVPHIITIWRYLLYPGNNPADACLTLENSVTACLTSNHAKNRSYIAGWGDADVNQDNQITAGELHAYVQQNVIQQSSGSQTPELQGDADRVLVRFQ